MRTLSMLLAALATAGTVASATAGTVDVRFVQPEKFSDVQDTLMRRDEVLQVLARQLQQLGASGLPASQTLQIEVLDVDLAGEVFPRVALRDVRVMRGQADWPRMHLRYTLRDGDRVLRSSEDHLADMSYQFHAASSLSDSPYGHEKRMLRRWFRDTFGTAAR